MNTGRRRHPGQPIALGLLVVAILVAGCSAGATGGTPGTIGTATPSPVASGPNAPVTSEPGAGGGVNPGMPGVGKAELTVPKPGQLDVHPVAAQLLEAFVDGRHVTIRVTWTSGVEPCNVLDSIGVERGHASFGIVIREGHAPGNNVCIEIAMQKQALVDLGELDPGTYTINDAAGGAAPIQVAVS